MLFEPVVRVLLEMLPDLCVVIRVQAKTVHSSPDLKKILPFFEKPFKETVSSQHPSNRHHSSPSFSKVGTIQGGVHRICRGTLDGRRLYWRVPPDPDSKLSLLSVRGPGQNMPQGSHTPCFPP